MNDRNAFVLGVALLLVGLVVGGAFVYESEQQKISQLQSQYEQQIQQLQYQLSHAQYTGYIEPSDIRMSIPSGSSSTLNYTAAVNSTDDVASTTYQNTTIKFTVKSIAPSKNGQTTVWLKLRVPGQEDGLPTELQQDEFQIYAYTATGTKTWLWGTSDWQGGFKPGVPITLAENQETEINLATVMKACNDVFEDGQSYTITLYLWEPGTGPYGNGAVVDTITLTLET